MTIVTFDVETTTKQKSNGSWTPSPFFDNRLFSLGFKLIDESHVDYLCFYHENEKPTVDAFNMFQNTLDKCKLLIGHNIKFDLMWLRECGWQYNGEVYDTMVGEYILAGSRRWPLSLAAIAEKYEVGSKKKDLVQPYLDDGYTFDKIPYEIVKEYGIEDVVVTELIAIKQIECFNTTLERLYERN